MTIGFQIALWKICAKYRPFQIVSFMQEARISYTKTSQTKSRTFRNNISVCGLLIIRYISPRLIKDKVEVQFLGNFFSSDALRVFLYQFIAILRGTGCWIIYCFMQRFFLRWVGKGIVWSDVYLIWNRQRYQVRKRSMKLINQFLDVLIKKQFYCNSPSFILVLSNTFYRYVWSCAVGWKERSKTSIKQRNQYQIR